MRAGGSPGAAAWIVTTGTEAATGVGCAEACGAAAVAGRPIAAAKNARWAAWRAASAAGLAGGCAGKALGRIGVTVGGSAYG